MGLSQRWLHFEVVRNMVLLTSGGFSQSCSLVNPCRPTWMVLSFCRKKAVMHVMENCHTLLGMHQPEICIRAYTINKQHLTDVGMSCGMKHAEKEPFSGCWSLSGICDLRILRPTCCTSLPGVCRSLLALSAQNLSYTLESSWGWLFLLVVFLKLLDMLSCLWVFRSVCVAYFKGFFATEK